MRTPRKIAKVYVTRNRSNFKAYRLRKTSNDPRAPRLFTGNEIAKHSQRKVCKRKVYASSISNFNHTDPSTQNIIQSSKEKRVSIISDVAFQEKSLNLKSDPISLNSSVVCGHKEEHFSNNSDGIIAEKNNCVSQKQKTKCVNNDLNVPSRTCRFRKPPERISYTRDDNNFLRKRNNNRLSDAVHRKVNIETTVSDDFISIGDMKYVKVVRWDHPSSKGKAECNKKCGMNVKNYTIENICKFNNIHYSTLGFDKFLSSRLYVDKVNNMLSIYPLQQDENFNPTKTKRNHSRRKRGVENSMSIEKCRPGTNVSDSSSGEILYNFTDIDEKECTKADQTKSSFQFDVTDVSSHLCKEFPKVFLERLCLSPVIKNSVTDFSTSNEFPKILLEKLPLTQSAQVTCSANVFHDSLMPPSNNVLFRTSKSKTNERSTYRKKFASPSRFYMQELDDSFNDISDCFYTFEKFEPHKSMSRFMNNKMVWGRVKNGTHVVA